MESYLYALYYIGRTGAKLLVARQLSQRKAPVTEKKDTSKKKYGDTDNHSFQNVEKRSIHDMRVISILRGWFWMPGYPSTEMPFIVNRGTTPILERERPLFFLPLQRASHSQTGELALAATVLVAPAMPEEKDS